jgi:glutathione synthase/RimK-type ligase-like ATP-grasp enzyme
MPILFVDGVNDRSVAGIRLDENERPVYLVDGNCSIHRRLPLKEGVAASLTLFGKAFSQHGLDFSTVPSLIFNQIADADTHRGALEKCIQLCEQVNTTVINHPRAVLETTRDRVAGKLQNIPGVIMPRTRRFRPRAPEEVLEYAVADGIGYPFIARVAGEHQGRRMIRVDSQADAAGLHALPFDGRDFYLSEYVDCRGEDGYYHKQRIVVIDGEPILRHSLFSDEWKVHGTARGFMLEHISWEQDIADFQRVSGELLPPLRPAIDEITRRLGLQYYGIDGHLREDGRLVVFEANANMNVLHSPNPEAAYRVEAIQQNLYALLTKYSGERVL